jgi:2-isopropylmalate synthase
VNISDTVGYAQPAEFARLVRHLHDAVPAFAEKSARISVHCHNDLGLAAANTLAGIEGGASQIEVTIGGVGERAGNAALEEIAACLDARRDYYDDVHLNYDARMTARLASLLASITGVAPRVSAPVVGWNSFAHASGIHQDGMRANERMYSVLEPTHFGYRGQTTALSRHSGKSGLRTRAEALGIVLDDAALESLSLAFKRKADAVRSVSDTEFIALLAGAGHSFAAALRLDSCERGDAANGASHVRITLHESGHARVLEGEGALWSDAVLDALRGVERDISIVSFAATQVAVAGGVRGRGCAEIDIAGERMRAEAQDDDPATALARCIIDAINVKRCRRTP